MRVAVVVGFGFAIEQLALTQDGLPSEGFIRLRKTGISGKLPIILSSFISIFG